MGLIDISRQLVQHHPNWPGDTPYTYTQTADMTRGSSVNIGAIQTSTHTGTHVDAPWHYDNAGGRLHEIPLEVFVGPCMVIDATQTETLTPEVLLGLNVAATRAIFKTGQSNTWQEFPDVWASVDPRLPAVLKRLGVVLFGTDAPSVDTLHSKDLPAHKAFRDVGIYILEGLALAHVQAGAYRLVCLPLPLHNSDGAPARAILETL